MLDLIAQKPGSQHRERKSSAVSILDGPYNPVTIGRTVDEVVIRYKSQCAENLQARLNLAATPADNWKQ
jgi:hypothetical protein